MYLNPKETKQHFNGRNPLQDIILWLDKGGYSKVLGSDIESGIQKFKYLYIMQEQLDELKDFDFFSEKDFNVDFYYNYVKIQRIEKAKKVKDVLPYLETLRSIGYKRDKGEVVKDTYANTVSWSFTKKIPLTPGNEKVYKLKLYLEFEKISEGTRETPPDRCYFEKVLKSSKWVEEKKFDTVLVCPEDENYDPEKAKEQEGYDVKTIDEISI